MQKLHYGEVISMTTNIESQSNGILLYNTSCAVKS